MNIVQTLTPFYRFLDECFEITDEKADRIKKTDFEAQYQKWCVVNDFKALNKRNIKERFHFSMISSESKKGKKLHIRVSPLLLHMACYVHPHLYSRLFPLSAET